ncbi:alpha-2 adrenergic receptor [Trichonephila clavipes]|nr:alpha-2 adrenergic receptor [Trichonephila clavipes]
MTFSNICGRISAIIWPYIGECCLPNGQAFVAYPHRPMTLHSPTENSLAVLNHKILEANSQVQKFHRCFDIHLWISFTPNAAVLFVDVVIQPEVRFIAKQNSLMKIGNNGNLVLGPFDESTPCLTIVLMNCQNKLRINPLTAVKSVAILESNANLNF